MSSCQITKGSIPRVGVFHLCQFACCKTVSNAARDSFFCNWTCFSSLLTKCQSGRGETIWSDSDLPLHSSGFWKQRAYEGLENLSDLPAWLWKPLSMQPSTCCDRSTVYTWSSPASLLIISISRVDRAGAAMATKIKQPIHWRLGCSSSQFGDLLFNTDH